MAIREHTLADFDRPSRQFEAKVEIFFIPASPITVYDNDYLVSFDILEEMCSDSSTLMGSISAGTLTVSLYNGDYRFSPENTAGPYYGSLIAGIKVKPYIRMKNIPNSVDPLIMDELNWICLGEFFTTDWTGDIGSDIKILEAEDAFSLIIGAATNDVQVLTDTTFALAFEYALNAVGATYDIDGSLTNILPIFAATKNADEGDLLQELCLASAACCYCDRSPTLLVRPLIAERESRHTLTDSNTIINVSTIQSIAKTTDGVNLTYNIPSLNRDIKALSIAEYKVQTGDNLIGPIDLVDGPVAFITHIALQTKEAYPYVSSFQYSPWSVTFNIISSELTEITSALEVYGFKVIYTGVQLFANSNKPLLINMPMLQTAEQADVIKALLDNYVDSSLPYIELNTRGNLLIRLNDLVTVNSSQANISMSGIVIRQQIRYADDLSTTMTLLNSDILVV